MAFGETEKKGRWYTVSYVQKHTVNIRAKNKKEAEDLAYKNYIKGYPIHLKVELL